VAAFTYLMTNPTPWVAVNLFRIVTLGRIFHTIVYTIIILPQPARGICFAMGFLPTIYMALSSMLYFL
jgi:glutathione S-transferase